MTNIITHQGIVENINGSQVSVRIIQTSACSACSVKGHCSSADSKEKVIEVTDTSSSYRVGDSVTLVGTTSMGMQAVLFAFVLPFFVLIVALFLFMALTQNELYAALAALAVLVPYYYIIWLNKSRLKRKFSFTIKPINN
ncbi:SoxR reducing system RseC family protein [Bacteroides sp.]